LLIAQMFAAERGELDGKRQQDRNRDHDRPHRHVQTEDGASDIAVAGAWIDVEQGLARRDDQQEQREQQADAIVARRIAVAEVHDDAEADAEHRHPL